MDWNAIILTILGTTSIGGVGALIAAIAYRKENKQLKKNEVKNSNTDAQRQQIDLGTKYAKEMLDLIERVEGKLETGEGNQKQMLEKIDAFAKKQDRFDERQDAYERMQGNIVNYLNGDFQAFLDRQYGRRKNKGSDGQNANH